MGENKLRGAGGRFTSGGKKSAAGASAGGINGKPVVPIAGERIVEGVIGPKPSESDGGLAPPDRPGLTPVQPESLDQLEREALVAAASVPAQEAPPDAAGDPNTPAPAGPSEEEVLAGYNMVCTEVLNQAAGAIVPAWRITQPEVSKLSTACSRALLLWFPDMIIPPKYMALLVIAGVGFEIVQARRDPETGALPPRHFPPAQKQPTTATAQ